MADKTVWQMWDCTDCGHKRISCKQQACPECDHRRTFEEFDSRYMPNQISADGKITVSAVGTEAKAKGGVWLNLFCPEDSCELRQSTDLP